MCHNPTSIRMQKKHSIGNPLNTTIKNNILPNKKSGIYQIHCKDCEKLYIEKKKDIWKLLQKTI